VNIGRKKSDTPVNPSDGESMIMSLNVAIGGGKQDTQRIGGHAAWLKGKSNDHGGMKEKSETSNACPHEFAPWQLMGNLITGSWALDNSPHY